MARGVQHAAVIVCFMSQKYEESKNCALELKFAAQTGVPIVPAMVQSGFTASRWLGILTAGLLWTRLWQPSTFDADVDSLIQQMLVAVDEGADDTDTSVGTDTIDEVKDELLRLREDTEVRTKSTEPAQEAWIPPTVKSLPIGLLITTEMVTMSPVPSVHYFILIVMVFGSHNLRIRLYSPGGLVVQVAQLD
eukprot:COSAG01_NODE_14161_length_1489_cov_1.278417_3_plen_192_part_00